ncbi:MAG: 30S ribosomal protein S28e [Nanoarchaeota archaeon]|nr:30S ribosomal protein S28e [Nanoarchaeota archaeon]MBU1135137.1 30S ribosomal protein S28e [Nanoarchaeota archaeon]MBU2520187.1 30S ribosomal protein S28e [Nanoarchaeota archaeon]
MSTPAEITEVMGRMGVKGVSRVRCRVLDGKDRGKVLTRNVVGPIRVGDILVLKDTAMDAEGRFQKR